MKKLLISLLAGLFMSAGLVATTTTAANADCGYETCTDVKVKPEVKKAKKAFKAKVGVVLKPKGADAGPVQGTVTFSCATYVKKHNKIAQRTRSFPAREDGNYNFKLKPGGAWSCSVIFTADPSGGYESSNSIVNVKVNRG